VLLNSVTTNGFGSVEHNTICFVFIFTLATCFGQLIIIRSSLQKLEQDVCSAVSIRVIWDTI